MKTKRVSKYKLELTRKEMATVRYGVFLTMDAYKEAWTSTSKNIEDDPHYQHLNSVYRDLVKAMELR